MLIASGPASLDTLQVSVPPAVLLAAAFCVPPTLNLDDFVTCYFGCSHASVKRQRQGGVSEGDGSQSRGYSGSRHDRKESEGFKSFTYEELTKRDRLEESRMPGFPRHTPGLGASRRIVGSGFVCRQR